MGIYSKEVGKAFMWLSDSMTELILLKKCSKCNDGYYAKKLCKKCYMNEWRINNEKHISEYSEKNYERKKIVDKLRIREKRKDPIFCKKESQKLIEKYHIDLEYRKELIKRAKKWQEINPERNKNNKERWKKNNPRSIKHKNDILMVLNMNNVRKRDNNICQWYECGLTYKKTTIHVHHIFPQSEYPQYKYKEKYMICYCKQHHQKWHKSRNDPYWRLIK